MTNNIIKGELILQPIQKETPTQKLAKQHVIELSLVIARVIRFWEGQSACFYDLGCSSAW